MTVALMPPLEPEPDDPKPDDPPCLTCDHPASEHEGYVCSRCYDWGGPCA